MKSGIFNILIHIQIQSVQIVGSIFKSLDSTVSTVCYRPKLNWRERGNLGSWWELWKRLEVTVARCWEWEGAESWGFHWSISAPKPPKNLNLVSKKIVRSLLAEVEEREREREREREEHCRARASNLCHPRARLVRNQFISQYIPLFFILFFLI